MPAAHRPRSVRARSSGRDHAPSAWAGRLLVWPTTAYPTRTRADFHYVPHATVQGEGRESPVTASVHVDLRRSVRDLELRDSAAVLAELTVGRVWVLWRSASALEDTRGVQH